MNRTVQWRCPSALPPSGTGNKISLYFFSARQSVSKLSLFSLIEIVSYFSRHGKVQASLLCSWLIEKFQIFAAVHKSNVLNSATKLILSNLSPNLSAYYAHGSHGSHGYCSRRGAHRGLEHEIILNTNNPNWTNNFAHGFCSVFYMHTDRTDFVRGGALTGDLNTRLFWTRIIRIERIILHTEARSAMLTFECWMLNCCVWPQCGIAQWWISMLTWWLLNENDTNEINMDSTRSFVITHCLCSVLKLEFLYSFSPTIGK